MGLIADLIAAQATNGSNWAKAQLVILKEDERRRNSELRKELINKEVRRIQGRSPNMDVEEARRIAEISVCRGWNTRGIGELRKLVSALDRDVELRRIEEEKKKKELWRTRSGPIIKEEKVKDDNRPAWTLDEIMDALSRPEKLRMVAEKLGWNPTNGGKISSYLRWRLEAPYDFGTEARSSEEIQILRNAAQKVRRLLNI